MMAEKLPKLVAVALVKEMARIIWVLCRSGRKPNGHRQRLALRQRCVRIAGKEEVYLGRKRNTGRFGHVPENMMRG
ncbi:MAG: hypothetical protein OXI81_02875 [Paracoccaceae bacterium]|nr:hypothetical protein [Paracoccaceae bacterium]